MHLTQLQLQQFRGLSAVTVNLHPQLTVFAGINGAGKSALLDSCAILLSWLIARVRSDKGSGRAIREIDIYNQAKYTVLQTELCHKHVNVAWQLVKTRKGVATVKSSQLKALSAYAQQLQQQLEQQSLPVFAYYPVNRAVLDIPLRIRQKHEENLLSAWEDALTSAANFRSFFEWFRQREDLDNEQFRLHGNESYQPDQQLAAAQRALSELLPEFSQFSVRRQPLRMVVQKQGQEVRVDQLSDGEKILIALVGDLARRLAIANPALNDPLQGQGIVLIDEIDLHLHPAWQRRVVPQLLRVFPNCQFLISTHSPQVLSEIAAPHIRLLQQTTEHGLHIVTPTQAKGLSSNDVLDELMLSENTPLLSRNAETQAALDELFQDIALEKWADAQTKLETLKQQLAGDIPELIEAEALLWMAMPDETV